MQPIQGQWEEENIDEINDEQFIEYVFEACFGDSAIAKGYQKEDVLSMLDEMNKVYAEYQENKEIK